VADVLAVLSSGRAVCPPDAAAQACTVRVKRYWKLPVAVTPYQALRQG
jgi:hypothetical protein